jgi:hypothetical protein
MATNQFNESERRMLKERYEGAISAEERQIADMQLTIKSVETDITALKEREPYQIAGAVTNQIRDALVQAEGLRAAISGANAKIAEWRGFIQRLDSEAAQRESAVKTMNTRLEAEHNNSTQL